MAEAYGILTEATFKSRSGYCVLMNGDQYGSTKNSSGWLDITGELVPESEVPVPADRIEH